MAVVIPQVITEDRAAAPSFVTGSFSFPKRVGQQKLMYQPQSSGDTGTFTVSMWVKNTMPDAIGQNPLWSASPAADNNNYYGIYLGSDELRYHNANPSTTQINGDAKLRDPNGWYHILTKVDINTARCYINGEAWGGSFTLNGGWWNNSSYRMMIGSQSISGGESGAVYAGYTYSQVYHIDGQAFGPHKFGFTDPLTGVWTPKKLTSVNDGTVYSNYLTSNTTINAPTSAFDGLPGNSAYTDPGNPTTIVFTPPKPIPVTSTIEIRSYGSYASGAQSAVLNDGEASVSMTIGYWATLYGPSTPTEIRKIELTATGASAQAGLAAIRVDGEILKDNTTEVAFGTNGFYLPMNDDDYIGKDFSGNGHNFRGDVTTTASEAAGYVLPHTTLDKATGAIPILKTDPSGQIITGGPRTHKITYKVTVQDDGGNKYFLNGVRYSPGTLPLYRGGVYKFDQSDASNGTGGTHPLRFATAADAAGSTEYTDGVTQNGTPGTAGAYTLIVVPHNAPDTLHYYCTNHGGMGGPTANTTDIHVADPYAWKLQLAVPFAARYNILPSNLGLVNYAQSTRADSLNPLGANIYLSNTGCQNAANEFVYYGGSRRYQGSTGQYQTLSNASTALAFGTEDFTVEFWAKFDTRGGSGVSAVLTTSTTSQNAGSWIIGFDNSDNFGWCYNVSGFSWSPAGKTQNTFREWHHYAFSRESNYLKMFIDGVQVSYGFINTDYNYTGSTPKIGQRWTNSDAYSLHGELQDLRVYKGVSKYNTPNNNDGNIAFLCGSTRPSVLPEVPKGTPYPGFLKKTPSGSLQVYNDAASGAGAATLGSRLTVPHHADLNMGNGDFTIEGFMYIDDPNLGGAYHTMISKNGPTFNLDTSWYIRTQNYNGIAFGWYTGSIWTGPATAGGATAGVLETGWNHFAGVKHGNMSYLFVNGKKIAELDVTGQGGPQDTTENVTIGTAGTFGDSTGSNSCNGYISNIRIVKGTAVYTDDFEPPTENLENISGTVLLCCQSSTNVTEAAVSPTTITANGRAGASNFSPFINNLAQLRGPENNYATLEEGSFDGMDTEIVDGGLSILPGGASPWYNRPGSMGVSSGKWYWEVYPKSDNVTPIIGAGQDGHFMGMFESDVYPGQTSYGNAFGIQSNGTLRVNGTSTGGWHNTFGLNNNNNSTVSIALDMDEGKAYIAVNGFWGPLTATGTNEMVSSGTATPAATGLTGTYRPCFAVNGGDSNDRMDINFGQRPFRYTPPEGFKCLNRTNLPTPSKAARNANKNFDTILWTGDTSGNNRRIRGLNFQPDLIIIKSRHTSNQYNVYDSSRGVNKHLTLDNNYGQSTTANSMSAFYPDGFEVGTGASDNTNGYSYVAWCWKAGTGAVLNQDGSSNAQVNANRENGFSIITYDGAGSGMTIGHGLERAPEFIMFKALTSSPHGAQHWYVYHHMANQGTNPEQYSAYIDLNNTWGQDSTVLNDTAVTDSIITLGSSSGVSYTGQPYVAYAWHSVEGFSKMGGYYGNAQADNARIETGFKPAWIMVKRYGASGDWAIWDSTRATTNPANNNLTSNATSPEASAGSIPIDITSTGFTIRSSGSTVGTFEYYIYVAFAEAPTNAGFGAVVNAR